MTVTDARRFGRRFTDEEKALIRERYDAGISCNAIAVEINANHKSITSHLEGLGIEIERRWPSGKNHPNWVTGRYQDPDGYVSVRIGKDHPHRGMANKVGSVRENRLVMAEHLGRDLYPDETVHHKNGVRNDNRLENLELMTHVHPHGQRASDQVTFAVEVLGRYAPHLLKGEK